MIFSNGFKILLQSDIIFYSDAFKQFGARGRDDFEAVRGILIFKNLSVIVKLEFHLA